MRHQLLLFITALCGFLYTAEAQVNNTANNCSFRKSKQHLPQAKTTLASPDENDYDVKHLFFKLGMSNTSLALQGDVTTTAAVTAASMNKYVFELDSLFTIDSFKLNGQIKTVTTDSFVRSVALATALTQGSSFTAEVFYHGTPVSSGGFFDGITHSVTSSGVNMVYTLSDPYNAKNWWPCKQSLLDKIDSADMWITVPSGNRAGCNGVLQAVTTPQPGYQQYRWKTKYPISYYLLSVAVAPYNDYTYQVHFTGSNDSMPVQNYYYDSATFMPAHKTVIDSMALMLDYFSTLYGRYPFWKEKYGHCFSTLQGGMEHQTMSTVLDQPDATLIVHEMGHQWFGDNVGYKLSGHVWLSEGFATYTEDLFVEHFRGITAAKNYRTAQFDDAMQLPGGRVFVDDTTSAATLFDGRLVYDKGAAVVHMLRYWAPQDSLFFQVLRSYQQQYAYGMAVTEDLQHIAEQAYGRSLDTFFNQWIYGQGYPVYTVRWMQTGAAVKIRLTQNTSVPAVTPMFYTPLEVKLHSLSGHDTVVKIYNNQQVQDVYVTWNYPVSISALSRGIVLDPDNNILEATAALINDTTLSVTNLTTGSIKVYPNPAGEAWHIENITAGSNLVLSDINGRQLWKGTVRNSTAVVPAASLAPGNYMLEISAADGTKSILKLAH